MRWLVAALWAAVIPAAAAPLYRVVNLGNFGGQSAVANDISNSGAIAGGGVTQQSQSFAAAWNVAESVLLGAPACGDAVNYAGDVAGTDWSSGAPRAAMWTQSGKTIVARTDSYALGLNDTGQVAGAAVWDGRMQAFVWGPGGLQMLSTPGSWSAAYDINNAGQVVGTYSSGGAFQAFAWTASGGVRSLGTLGGRSSYAMSVSDTGWIAGSAMTSAGYLHAFLWDGGMRDLGTLGGTVSAAYGVNAQGSVVGYSYDADGRQRGFVWRDGVLWDLNQLIEPAAGWTIEAAYGINDYGQIVGSAVQGGQRVAVLLDPISLAVDAPLADAPVGVEAPVPEPGTRLLAGLAAAVVFALRCFRRA